MTEAYKNGTKCLVIRDGKILMVKHRHDGKEYYTLPGGGIEEGETPEQAAVRELWEECNVVGKVLYKTSEFSYWRDGAVCHTFNMDIGDQVPTLGLDSEFSEEEQVLADICWLFLNEVCERDRAFLWASGLISIPKFTEELLSWGDDIIPILIKGRENCGQPPQPLRNFPNRFLNGMGISYPGK